MDFCFSVKSCDSGSNDCSVVMNNDVKLTRVQKTELKGESNHLECRHCGKLFKKRRNVVRHERIHTGEKPFGCVRCGRRFSDESTMRQHLRTHSNEMRFLCNECGKFFKSRNGLKYHRCANGMFSKPYSEHRESGINLEKFFEKATFDTAHLSFIC
jgi:DNA-directed RNA polymerase subunit RPC12/RpoP